jgi:hypothetical protein
MSSVLIRVTKVEVCCNFEESIGTQHRPFLFLGFLNSYPKYSGLEERVNVVLVLREG